MAFTTSGDDKNDVYGYILAQAYLAPLLLAISYVAYERFFSPLAGIPGPFLASLTRLWITALSWRGGTHHVMPDLHKRHGKLVRIGPNEVSIAEPAAIKQIYGAGNKFRKSDWYSVWQGHRKFDLFPERDEKIHAAQRRLVSRPYAMESLKLIEEYVDDAISVFLKRMNDIRGESIDMGAWLQLFAFDVIGEVTFSKRFGFMDVGEEDGTFKQIEAALRSASWLGQIPWLYWLHDYLSPLIGNHLAITARHGGLRNFAIREVNERKERSSVHQDMVGQFLEIHAKKPEEMNEAAVMSMASSNIMAGSDTTATSLRAVLYYLLKNPQCKQKLIDEIDAAKQAEKLSDPVKLDEAQAMPYLQAVMYEGLRCHPAVGMSLPRVVPEGGFQVSGRFIPAGTVVGTNPWVIHRDVGVFGADADRFNPDRWLKEDTSEMQRCFFTFGAGARTCLGKNIGWMEMSKLIPTMFMHYDVQLTDPAAEWTMTSWWFVMQKGIHVMLRPRT